MTCDRTLTDKILVMILPVPFVSAGLSTVLRICSSTDGIGIKYFAPESFGQ